MKSFVLAASLLALGASPVLAANATHPYANCDKKVDNCGPTGDDATDQLNAQQLGQGGPAAPMPGSPMPGGPMQPMPPQPMPQRY